MFSRSNVHMVEFGFYLLNSTKSLSMKRTILEKRGLESATYQVSEIGIVASSKKRVSAVSGKRVTKGNNVFSRILLILYSMRDFFASIFLPDGYPDSVSDDYLSYQMWDTLQALCSSITGLLSTQAMLQGFGVGRSEATAIGATMQWVVKNGTGMLGRLTFAWWKGSELGHREKFYRLLADVLCDMGNCLELISPLLVSVVFSISSDNSFAIYFQTDEELRNSLSEQGNVIYYFGSAGFLLFACLGSICSAIVGVAGGATRACLTQHQAKRDNLADVSAKDGSQETGVNLLGLLIGLLITPMLVDQSTIWSLFSIFTVLHLFFNYRAVRSVTMDTFNRSRVSILLEEYFKSEKVLSCKQCNHKESVLQLSRLPGPLYFGCSAEEFFRNTALPEQDYTPFLIRIQCKNKSKPQTFVIFHSEAADTEIFKAYFYAQAMLLSLKVNPELYEKYYTGKSFSVSSPPPVSFSENLSSSFDDFTVKADNQHWNCSGLSLGDCGWRVSWNKVN